jgi:hypothetical protein
MGHVRGRGAGATRGRSELVGLIDPVIECTGGVGDAGADRVVAADRMPNTEIAQRTGTSRPTVLKWRGRYGESGTHGLVDEPRPSRVPLIDEVAVLAETLADKGNRRLIWGRRTGRRR